MSNSVNNAINNIMSKEDLRNIADKFINHIKNTIKSNECNNTTTIIHYDNQSIMSYYYNLSSIKSIRIYRDSVFDTLNAVLEILSIPNIIIKYDCIEIRDISDSSFREFSIYVQKNLSDFFLDKSKNIQKEHTEYREKKLKLLASIDDKLQAIVFAPESSLFKEVMAEREKMK